ncbi:GGDEF domain-containing protein [Pseudomonadota bacterium]
MATRSADKIIDSLAHITRQTDRELLEASLASTLYDMLHLKRVALYKVFYEHNQPVFYLSVEIIEDKAYISDAHKMLTPAAEKEVDNLIDCQAKRYMTSCSSGNNSQYLYPVLNKQRVVVSVFSLEGNEPHCEEEEKFIAGYFQIYSNYLRLLDESEHDTLTGLLNRRTFDSNLGKLLAQWHRDHDIPMRGNQVPQRRHESVEKSNWLAVIDIDLFKRVNDQFGHLYGDEVLLLMANIMRESFRGYDKLFRFGGEEFVVILRNTDQEGAIKALERFRTSVETYQFPQTGKVTVSIGYVGIGTQAVPSEVLSYADEALYYVKQHGRNQTCQYEALVKEGKLTPSQKKISCLNAEVFDK